MFKNKKAQTGETITWIVATIIIFVILMFFILGASLLGGTKKILMYKDSAFSGSQEYVFDNYLQKSVYTYFNAEDSIVKGKIKSFLEEKNYDFDSRQREIKEAMI